MALSSPSDERLAAVLFMDGAKVSRQMRATEFDAFLDGYVGLSDLADTDVHAVYVVLNDQLGIKSLVFFRIYFDEEGRADGRWNLPLDELADRGVKGPDLGHGPIRLACKSHSPRSSVAEELWDPDMSPESNQFSAIREAIETNRLKFRPRKSVVKPKSEPAESIPVLSPEAPPSVSGAAGEAQAERNRLAQMIRDYRMQVRTLKSAQNDALAELRREHSIELQELKTQIQDLEQKLERQRVANEQLKTRLAERNEQYLVLQEELSEAQTSNESASEASDAETVLLREQLDRKQRELEMRNEQIVQLEQERDQWANREPPEESVLARVRDQSVFLVAFHPGVGHITLPYEELERYFDNPEGYAAEKSGVSEAAYREWLKHYDNPICQADIKGEPCGEPVMRISQPADFRAGVHDRCSRHQKEAVDTA